MLLNCVFVLHTDEGYTYVITLWNHHLSVPPISVSYTDSPLRFSLELVFSGQLHMLIQRNAKYPSLSCLAVLYKVELYLLYSIYLAKLVIIFTIITTVLL